MSASICCMEYTMHFSSGCPVFHCTYTHAWFQSIFAVCIVVLVALYSSTVPLLSVWSPAGREPSPHTATRAERLIHPPMHPLVSRQLHVMCAVLQMPPGTSVHLPGSVSLAACIHSILHGTISHAGHVVEVRSISMSQLSACML